MKRGHTHYVLQGSVEVQVSETSQQQSPLVSDRIFEMVTRGRKDLKYKLLQITH